MTFLVLLFLAAWSGSSIMLPLALVCGLVDWAWWICAAPAGTLFLSGVGFGLFNALLARISPPGAPTPREPEHTEKTDDDVTEEDIREVELLLRELGHSRPGGRVVKNS